MATGTGLNVTKANAYAALAPIAGLNVSKVQAYAVLITGSLALTGSAGIVSAEAFGSTAAELDLTIIGASGIASAETFGTGGETGNIVGTLGISSGETFGVPAGAHGTVTGPLTGAAGITSAETFGADGAVGQVVGTAGIASEEAFGADGIIASGIVGVTGIPSGEALTSFNGSVSEFLIGEQGIGPPANGIASGEAFGASGLVSSRNITGFAGIRSGEAFGSTGAVISNAFTLFIGGVDRTAYLQADTFTFTANIGQRWTGEMSLYDPAGTYRPLVGQEVLYYKGSTRLFGGSIEETDETWFVATPAILINCKLADYSALMDHRIIQQEYSTFSTAALVLQDVVDTRLAPDGFLFKAFDDASIDADLVFDAITATEAFNQLANATGLEWSCTPGKTLLLYSNDSGIGAAPFSIADDDGNWRNMTVKRTRSQYRNRQGVRPSQNLQALQTDTFHGQQFSDGTWQTVFVTTYNLGSDANTPPDVRLNGVPVKLTTLGDWTRPYDFYWIVDGVGVFQNQSATPIQPSDTLTVTYPFPLPMNFVWWFEDGTAITARAAIEGNTGVYEAVEEGKDVVDAITAQAYAEGLLARYGSAVALELDFETDDHIQPLVVGLQPGQKLISTVSKPAAAATWLVTQVVYKEVGQTYGTYDVVCQAQPTQASSRRFWADLVKHGKLAGDRTHSYGTWHLAESIPNVTNVGLAVGANLGTPYIVKKPGVLKDVTAFFQDAPTTDNSPVLSTDSIIIDILQNGVSVLGSKTLVYPPGTTSPLTVFTFTASPINVVIGDIFTLSILQVGSKFPGANGTVVLDIWT